MAGKAVEEKLYIVRAGGIKLPGMDRKNTKLGATVKLPAEVGDKFCERGFLQDADTVVETEGPDAKLVRENERLKDENARLKKQLADSKS